MEGSRARVQAVINGITPDRAPLFELIHNDSVIEHFAGAQLSAENGDELAYAAFGLAADATRPGVRSPQQEIVVSLEDGRQHRQYRWTSWTEHLQYPDAQAYQECKLKEVESYDPAWDESDRQAMARDLQTIRGEREKLGDVFLFPSVPGPGLMALYTEVGLEPFSYYMADCPEVIDQLLEVSTQAATAWVEHLPCDHGIEAVFLGDDIAFNTSTILPPTWMRKRYFPRLGRIIHAYHGRGIKVLFHSDGNLNGILEDLVEAGIDGLNPIETLSDMDVAEIHRRYPHLFLAGGIDGSQLLPFGTPEEIRSEVRRVVDAAEGRLLVGSSSEVHNDVPLESYLALREAVLENPY